MGEVNIKRVIIANPDSASRKVLALLIARKLDIHHVDEATDTGTLIHKLLDCCPDLLPPSWHVHDAEPKTCALLRNTYRD